MSRHDTDLNLTPELLLRAYAAGIFPMADTRDTSQVYWVDPKHRGVLPIVDFHVPRRLRRTVRNSNFEITCNTDFAEVVAMCAQATKSRGDTWINPSIEVAVNELSNMGFAHSVECRQDGELVGGLYGISLGAAFFWREHVLAQEGCQQGGIGSSGGASEFRWLSALGYAVYH